MSEVKGITMRVAEKKKKRGRESWILAGKHSFEG